MADTQDEPVQPAGGQAMPEDPGYSYDELQKESLRQIASNTDEPNKAPKEEPTPEEKPEEPPVEEPEVPLEDFAKQVAEETTQKVLERQRLEAEEAAKKEQEAAVKDPKEEYQEIVKEFQEKEGRAPTWDELAVKIEERTIEKLTARQQAEAKRIQDEQEAQQKQQTTEQQQLDSHIDDELEDLYRTNKLTRIKDPSNPSDPGVIERKSLFQAMYDVNKQRQATGKELIASPIRVAEFYWKRPVQQPGADAPVSGNKASGQSTDQEQEYSYTDLKKPWSFFRRGN